ncbi:MAG: hypothetical protein A3F40_03655 [Chlamydiae bacterium RIFCSPHIGHO2_12_FULL_27_8]|nr:MAG: hypothetical protein A3F40_03655 [Chlamydiae bacterium RIFCSPHIGHO2_12_FULL_27_8]OGN65395.1 MAG: hypothetical protein A2888_02745 [Chlamydiae bacterium RIFCSPLOWO2_01_FULL_28_7]
MSAHPSFSSNPDQSPHKYFKNLLLKFKKEIKKNTEKTYLEEKMEDLINAAKQMIYIDSPKNSIFHKPETQKAIEKVFSEFDRYIREDISNQDLLDSIEILEELIDEYEIY